MTKQQELRGQGGETLCSYFGLTAEECAVERGTERCDKHSGPSPTRPEMRRVPGEIIRSVRHRSNGQQPVTYGLSLVVLDEDVPGATSLIPGESVGELRDLARHLGLTPVVTWSNSRVVVHHAARTQGRTMTKSDTLTVEQIAAMGAVERVEAAKKEAALVKEAKRRGDSEMPSTPVLDYMNGTEYREMQKNKTAGKRTGTSGSGKAVNFDEAELRTKCVALLAAGHTTKAAMLKALRAEGKGARQQRFYPIADAVIEEAKRNGTFPEKAAAPAKKAAAKKSAPAKSAAKKAPATKAPAKKAAPAKSTAKKSATAAKTTAAKKVTPRFKASAAATKKRTSTARVSK